MNNLIKISDKGLVSAKELYLGLGLNKTNWSRWYPTNIGNNDFFEKDIDWVGVRHNDEGNETMDFAISIEFAKHIAMMAKTKKSHEYRNYFIKCEKELQQPKVLTPQQELKLHYQVLESHEEKLIKLDSKVDDLENNMPLFNVECKELQALVNKIGVKVLGGKTTAAYKDNSTRGKVYADIQHQLRREFGVKRYEAIKRCQLNKAREIIAAYKAPTYLQDQISLLNNQISI
jgi:anti-repressor protein